MIPVTTFDGKKVAVFGLGGSGLASCHALRAGGAGVIAGDDDSKRIAQAAQAGFVTADLHQIDWSSIAALVLTPGVPLTHPAPHWSVTLARAAAVEVIGDIELFCRERRRHAPDAPFIAITGTNGKSTTTALTEHILRTAGRDTQLGGNIGTAILSLEAPRADRVHVIECSSYQIDLAPSLDPSIGVLINLSPDHLDRHGTMENYAAVKERLVAQAALSLVGVDDAYSDAIGRRLAERPGLDVIPVSAKRALPWGYFVRGTQIVSKGNNQTDVEVLGDLAGIATLRGGHNAQNAAFACAAAWHSGLDAQQIARALKTFPGLAHRMEEVGRKGNVLFINDSKATNADSTAQALACFDDIFWIAGGQPKTGGIGSLAPFWSRIRKAYLIGEAAKEFAAELEGKVPHVIAGTMDNALKLAAHDAANADVAQAAVLLSPACASFDQFRNFEVRGDAFRGLVRSMPDIERPR
jgi:UDP-N-acetylmuramoylalanine--D-glutamate ligase